MSQHRVVGALLAVGITALGAAATPAEAWDGRPHRLHHHPRSSVILSFRFGVPVFSPYFYYAPPPYVVYSPYPYEIGRAHV